MLGVFLRPDKVIADEIRQISDEALHDDDAGSVTVSVKIGVVVLTGPLDAECELVAVATRLAWAVDGVVDVVDQRH